MVCYDRLNGTQKIASSILVSSATEKALFPLASEPISSFLGLTPMTIVSA